MPCKYFDCGWCYAPEDAETTAEAGQCNRMQDCPQSVSWKELGLPPINLNNSLSADNFYSDGTYNEDEYNLGDTDANHQDS